MSDFEEYIKKHFLEPIRTEKEIEHAIEVIQSETDNYIKKHKLRSLVLGISGGIDSAFAAALLKPVCEQNNISLIGRSITIETNTSDEINRSILVGENFCHNFELLDFTEIYRLTKTNLYPTNQSTLSKFRMGNCKARLRMITLYDLAQQHAGIVISTDNFTEYLTGFWTLHGDVGDFAPFIHLWKSEVYFASSVLSKKLDIDSKKALSLCIYAKPTDGLGISDSDFDQLNVSSYQEADKLFIKYFKGDKSLENHTLIKRFHSSSYKRNNPIIINRNILTS